MTMFPFMESVFHLQMLGGSYHRSFFCSQETSNLFEEMSIPETPTSIILAPVHPPTTDPISWCHDGFSEDMMVFGSSRFEEDNEMSAVALPDVWHSLTCSSSPSGLHPNQLGLPVTSFEPAPSGDAVDCDSNDGGDDEESSEATKTFGCRRDRSRTLVSERKRRGRMKEMLYELRSLVPNITKMDKASIIADAIVYLRNMQQEAEKLEGELRDIQASSSSNWRRQPPANSHLGSIPVKGEIKDLVIVDVGKRRFYLRLDFCCKGQQKQQPIAGLYAAIESVQFLIMESSDITSVDDGFVLTSTLEVSENGDEVDSQTLRIWLINALFHECFEFKTMKTM